MGKDTGSKSLDFFVLPFLDLLLFWKLFFELFLVIAGFGFLIECETPLLIYNFKGDETDFVNIFLLFFEGVLSKDNIGFCDFLGVSELWTIDTLP